MITIALGAFVIGLIAVWMYAAIRPRYGAGSTALRAAWAVWVLACLCPNASLLACGVLEPRLFTLSVVADLVFVPLGTVVGAHIYREVEASGARSRSGAAHAHA